MRITRLLVTAACLGFAGSAAAQDLAEPPASPTTPETQSAVETRDAGDIIVTARKRQESVLQVPVVETVLSAEQLDRRQVTTISDVATLTPGLVLGLSSLEIGTQVSIRGVGTTSLDPGIDQSVSLNLDGLQVTQGAAYSVGVFDMAQVEVLKGPQALFFGKNSPGGVVSIRTADPGRELEVIGRVAHEFVADEWRGEAIVSGPVSEDLGLRLAARYSDFGGFFRNTAVAVPAFGAQQPDRDFGQSKTLFLRGTALYRPTADLTARLKLNYTRDRQRGGAGYQLVSCPDGLGNYAGIPFISPNEDCKANRRLNLVDLDPAAFGGLPKNGHNYTDITQKFGTLELDYTVGPRLTLTSVSGYYDLKTDVMQNGTITGSAGSGIAAIKEFSRREYTQELRLTSDYASPVNFTLGGFYQNGKMKNDIQLAGNTRLQLPPRLAIGKQDVKIESISGFGQLRYKPSSVLELSGGVRFVREVRSNDPSTVDLFGAYTGTPGAVVFPQVPDVRSSNWSPELTVSYTPTPDLTIFGSLKQGYKSGSYNLIVPTNPGENNSFGDEKVQGGEIGLKSRLANRQLFANAAFYYYKYSGLQVGLNEPATGGLPIIRTVNAGSAKVYGIDFDVNFRPQSVPGLDVRAAVNWNHARFTSFVGAACSGGLTIAEGCNLVPNLSGQPGSTDPATGAPLFTAQDLSGSPLTRAPSWQANIGVNYEMPVGTKKLNFGLDGQYSSRYNTIIGRRRDFTQSPFAKLNANVALAGPNDSWEIALIANNLTNRLTSGGCTIVNYPGAQVLPGIITGGTVRGPAGSDEVVCTLDRGREVWLRFTLRQ